jgi:hypothetical protein
MPKHKNQYAAAADGIRTIADQKGVAGSVVPLLKKMHVFLVGLRREKAALSGRAQQLEQERDALRRELKHHAALPGELEEARSRALNLERRNAALDATIRQREELIDELKTRLRDCEPAVTGNTTFDLLKLKCLACSLHFTLCTWYPERHRLDSLHCPECGQHAGDFIIWVETGQGFIFQHVPGKARLVACCSSPGHSRARSDTSATHAGLPDSTQGTETEKPNG